MFPKSAHQKLKGLGARTKQEIKQAARKAKIGAAIGLVGFGLGAGTIKAGLPEKAVEFGKRQATQVVQEVKELWPYKITSSQRFWGAYNNASYADRVNLSIDYLAKQFGLDPKLVKILRNREYGNFNHNDISSKGAHGPWQIMPNIAKKLVERRILTDSAEVRDPFRSTLGALSILKEIGNLLNHPAFRYYNYMGKKVLYHKLPEDIKIAVWAGGYRKGVGNFRELRFKVDDIAGSYEKDISILYCLSKGIPITSPLIISNLETTLSKNYKSELTHSRKFTFAGQETKFENLSRALQVALLIEYAKQGKAPKETDVINYVTDESEELAHKWERYAHKSFWKKY